MAISHAGHDHPATPAARAACRKAMAGSAPAVGVVLKDGSRGTMTVAPRRGRKAAGPDMKPRALRNEGDLAFGVPHEFSNAIRMAWTLGWTVRTGDPYNDTEKRVLITSPAGELALVYKSANPGVWGVFWRPVGSSVTSRLMDAPVIAEGMRLLGGA